MNFHEVDSNNRLIQNRSGLPLLLLSFYSGIPPTPIDEAPRAGTSSFFYLVKKGKISPRWITPGSSVNEMIVSRSGFILGYFGLLFE